MGGGIHEGFPLAATAPRYLPTDRQNEAGHVTRRLSCSQRTRDGVACEHAGCHSFTHPPSPGVTGRGRSGGDWVLEGGGPRARCRPRVGRG
eukprot:2479501-Pleurochrysis_carterae.AAC.4